VLLLLALSLLGANTPDDPLAERQFHLRRVRAYEAWERYRGRDQIIAVLDTGVDDEHPDLKGQLVKGIDLVDPDTPPDDRNGHGTFVAGIAVAAEGNGKGGAGVAPRAKVMPVRVLDDEGMGRSDVVAEGIRWATREGATVINLSLADVPGQQRSPTSLITTDVELAIRQAALAGVVVVAAAGNDGNDSTPYSRDLPALVVGATTRRDAVWRHSNYDDRTLFAPGVGIISTYVGEPYAAADGTSFSTPIVSAAAALLLQWGKDDDETRQRLVETARPVGEGEGRVDVAAALGVAKRVRTKPSPPPEDPDDGDDEPRKNKPRRTEPKPVTEPSPIASEPPAPRTEPAATASPTPPSKKPPGPKKGRVKPAKGLESPSPIEVPSAAESEIAAPRRRHGRDKPLQRPIVPFVAAGILLFGVTAALGGYVVSRRSSV
jgi:subtilisin family serine protease